MVKPAPDKVAPLTMRAVVPLDVKVRDWVDGVPTATLPKATVLELTVRPAPAAGGAAATPVPVIWTMSDGLASASLVRVRLPVAAPAAAGSNWRLSVAV
jgi:hypothetical protein